MSSWIWSVSDRVHLNGYVPNLQGGGQVVTFMTKHLGMPIPSPAIMERIGTSFRRAVARLADTHQIPMIRFAKTDRRQDVMRPYLARQATTCQPGVVAIGVAQEYQNVFATNQRQGHNGVPWFSYTKADRRVTCYYFYLWDDQFGPGFIQVCAYFPYPVKIWVSTATSGPSGKLNSRPVSGSASCPTASAPATISLICRRSVTGSERATTTAPSTTG